MKKVITECDICGKAYDPSKEGDEPMHRLGLVDPPPLDPAEVARLDAEIATIQAELAKDDHVRLSTAYYEERAAALTREAEQRLAAATEERVEVDLICHACFRTIREYVKQMRRSR